ncbi:hypothetical protein WJ71_09520 [Burkholderia ubonensis]|nr:hypothetical protein WJ71_09520 [Burkholderia ubonensis]
MAGYSRAAKILLEKSSRWLGDFAQFDILNAVATHVNSHLWQRGTWWQFLFSAIECGSKTSRHQIKNASGPAGIVAKQSPVTNANQRLI